MNKQIAFFDFDGTITRKDTLFAFITHAAGYSKTAIGLLQLLPVLIKYKLGLTANQKAKEQVLTYFFKGQAIAAFQKKGDVFAEEVVPGLLRPAAIKELEKLQAAGFEIVIVTASLAHWIKAWTDKMGYQLIASALETNNGLITGKLLGKNCYGAEKVARIHAQYKLQDYTKILAFGDTQGDHPMLALANKSFYKPFRD